MSATLLKSLEARGFRNLAPLVWEPETGGHLILGDNGAGKTSLLEAIYVLATTRSFRGARLQECVRHGEGGFELGGEVEGDARARLGLSWSRGGGLARWRNGREVGLAEHVGTLPVLAWSSAELPTVTGGPAQRRRFMDRGLVAARPGSLALLGRFRRALEQKRQLLFRGDGKPAHLAPWNDLLAESGAELIAQRARYVADLGPVLAELVASSGLPLPAIEVVYRPSPRAGLEGRGALRDALEAAHPSERARGQPLIGPQRDDLELRWAGQELRGTASAGERKAVSLLLVAAQGRLLEAAGRPPLLLLDDFDAELSRESVERLWGVFAPARQLVVTSNRPEAFKTLEVARRWWVEEGRIGLQGEPDARA